MRSEEEMIAAIISFAEDEERIRAAVMNGSRVNPNAPRDFFQDYDVLLIASDVDAFVRDRAWIGRFGPLMIMQTPNDKEVRQPDDPFPFLLQFADGNRIDFTFYPLSRMDRLETDSLSLLLLDKDGLVPPLPPPSDNDYITRPPTAGEFADCCNEFWWVSAYVAKGLWRRELSYAKHLFEGPVRNMMILMLKWHIGVRTGFSADSGKHGKYFERYLEPRLWERYIRTYPDADYDNIWRALFVMGDLFRETAAGVASHLGLVYRQDKDDNVTAHLKHVQALPPDAAQMYE